MTSIYYPGCWNIQAIVGLSQKTIYSGDSTKEALKVWNDLRAKYRDHEKACYIELRRNGVLKVTMINKKKKNASIDTKLPVM